MNIDWSKAPEGYLIWIEDLKPEIFGDLGGWHRDDGDRYTDEHGNHWGKPALFAYVVHERPPEAAVEASAAELHPLQQCLRANGDLIAAQATITQQAQMIEHLRGGPTPGFTAVDIATAAADGFRDGVASVVVDLSKHHGGQHLPGTERMFLSDVIAAIEAAGGSVKP